MSSIDVGGALPGRPSFKLAWFKAVYSCEGPDGKDLPFEEWSRSAKRVFRLLLQYGWNVVRKGGIYQFSFRDRDLAHWGGVVRRTIQKGLLWLEKHKIITRPRIDGSRVITFTAELAGKESAPHKAPSKKAAKPAARPTSEPAAEKPAASEPEPAASAAEVAAWIAGIGAGDANPRRRVGLSLGTAVPKHSDEDRARRTEENRRRNEEWPQLGSKPREAQASGQDPPPAPSEPDEIQRE